ncbi:MAG: DUF2089 family protein [Chthoniobacterales bacterium]
MQNEDIPKESWIDFLSQEDTAFLKRFVLASGSLKELAKAYDVSYPTIRLRLDRMIQKIEIIESSKAGDAFERQLRGLLADGKLDETTFREILTSYRKKKTKENTHE